MIEGLGASISRRTLIFLVRSGTVTSDIHDSDASH